MGKTTLLREVVESLPASAAVGWGTCSQAEGAPGFWPWTQALDGLARAVGPRAALDAVGHDRDRLAPLVPELGPLRPVAEDADRQRFLLLDAAVRWVAELADRQHVVLVLDDLQWADPSTLDLLDHLVAASPSGRLLLLGAYRHDEPGPAAGARLAALSSHTENLRLEGLTPAEVEELVASIRGPELAHALAGGLHRRTGGHPLFVRELASLADTGSTEELLPQAVTVVVARRLDGFPPDLAALLDAASVLGNRLLPDVLAQVLDESVAVVLELIEPAVTAGVIHSDPGGELWFAHDLYREVLHRRLSLTERVRLHGLVASALQERVRRGVPVSPADLAHHFTRAVSVTDPARAIHWAREAARVERGRAAFVEAAAHLRRARQAVADVGSTVEPDLLVQILLEEADAHARSGDPDTARRLLAEAATGAPGPSWSVDVALAVQRLGAKFATPRSEIIAQLEAALASIEGHDVARQARVTAALARELQHSVEADRSRADPLSSAALALSRDADDETLASCLLARHDALWRPGTGVDRSALGREIAVVGERLGDTDRWAEGLLLEANGLLESGSPGFRPVLDRWFGLLEARDEPLDRYLVMTRRAALALLEGEAETAESLMLEAAALGERLHEPDAGNVLMSQRVALARIRDDPVELTALAEDAVRWWTGAPVLAHAVAAGAFAAAGDVGAAAREVAMLSAADGWRGEGSYLRSVLVADLARAATALHDTDLCTLLLDDITPLTDSCGVNGAVVAFAGPLAHPAGILAAELGDLPLATRLLQQSVATARRLGAVVWVDQGEAALRALTATSAGTSPPDAVLASLARTGTLWSVSFDHERATVAHVKGMTDLATLVSSPGRPVSALELVGAPVTVSGATDPLVDLTALRSYRARLAELDAELDHAHQESDLASLDRLGTEREQLLAELRRTTGLGGTIRPAANAPAERARKAVSGRIRDAIRRLDDVAPGLASHLDRSIRTGLRCCYEPPASEAPVRWRVTR